MELRRGEKVLGGLVVLRDRFYADTRGSIALMFAVLAIPLMGAIFLAIDYGRATSLKTSLQTAADAAAYTAAMRLGDDEDAVRAAFKGAFQANLPAKLASHNFTLSIADDEESLDVSLDARINTTLARIAGLSTINFRIVSHARKPTPKAERIAQALKSGKVESAKTQIIAEIKRGLAQAAQSGMAVPRDIDPAQLEALADMIIQQGAN